MAAKTCAWREVPSAFTGFAEGRRWILYRNSDKREEVTIEDNLEAPSRPFEIVGHDFVSGDIETIDDARTLQSAHRKVLRFIKRNPRGQYLGSCP